jgi:hypothetical protein
MIEEHWQGYQRTLSDVFTANLSIGHLFQRPGRGDQGTGIGLTAIQTRYVANC